MVHSEDIINQNRPLLTIRAYVKINSIHKSARFFILQSMQMIFYAKLIFEIS